MSSPNDPLRKASSASEQELFREIGRTLNAAPAEMVSGIAVNLLVNVLRQQHASKAAAERAFDEVVAKAKSLLLDQHYDLTGRRRNVFPFHQVVQMSPFDARKH
jgi:hypothetical protein